MDFDTEKFIVEVQNRPSIWNTKGPEYSDRNLKLKAWDELVNIYGPKLSTKEKKQLVLNLQKKWRNIRDCFVKAHKAKDNKSGSAAKKKLPYVFYDNLLFLKDTVSVMTTISYVNEVNEDVSKAIQNDDSPLYTWAPKRRKKNKNDHVGGELTRNLERNHFEGDDDRLFFLSLVKEFKKIPDHLQIQTKVDLLKVIQDAQCSDYPNTSWDYSRHNKYPGCQAAHCSKSNPCSLAMQSSESGRLTSRETIGSPVEVKSPLSPGSTDS